MMLLIMAFGIVLHAQTIGAVSGRITDKQTGEPLAGATVTIKGTNSSTITGTEGYFILRNIATGNIFLTISFVGYESIELQASIIAGSSITIDAGLMPDASVGGDVVISASMRKEKITKAPTTIRVIGGEALAQFPGSNVYELAAKLQGVEFVRSGIDYVALNARGFNRAANNKVLQVVDGRNSMSPVSTGLAMYNFATVNKEDVERIEMALGPQSALFGPNAHSAVLNTIMKDPRKYQGTTLAMSAGNHFQFSGRLRHAIKINNKWAYKITGEYMAGEEFIFYDSVFAGNQPPGTKPHFGQPVTIPERNVNFNFRRIRGEAHLYYSLTPKTDIILSAGKSHNNSIGAGGGGRNQMIGVSPGFIQARLVHPNFFVTVYNTWSNMGNSYGIAPYTRDYWNRTHSSITDCDLFPEDCYLSPDEAEKYALRNRIKERNQRLNAEAQYNYAFDKAGIFLVAGLNYQKEKPNSYGTTLVDKEKLIFVTQVGGVVQLEKKLPWDMRFIGAARVDHHSNYGSFFSPKLALTKTIGENNFRITWAKAYAPPSILFQYSNQNGMVFGNGPGVRYVPIGSKDMPESLISTNPLKLEEISTLEAGYKGMIARKLYIDINGYYGSSKNFLSAPQTVEGKAYYVGEFPVIPATPGSIVDGVVTGARFLTYFNYSDVNIYGLDIGITYTFNTVVSMVLNYSWFGSDISNDDIKNDANNDEYVSLEETSLNAPGNKASALLSFRNLCRQKVFANISARFTEQYDFYSGNHIGTEAGKGKRGVVYGGINPINRLPRYYLKNFDWGPLGGFASIDINAGYIFNEMLSMNAAITNLLNTKQIEFVGSPSIGRLILLELKVHIPNSSKH